MTPNHRLIIIATCSALSGLLFGYDAGIIAGALLFINKAFSMSASEQGWLVAMVPLGALLSSAISGKVSDVFGRKKTLWLTAMTFIAGSLLCAFAYTVLFLIIGRLILGIAIGIGSSAAPVYASELADEKHRGWLVNLFVVFIQLGVFLSFVLAFAYSHSGNWRLMIGLGIIPAVILAIAVFFIPESPRWLIAKNRIKQAKDILHMLYSQQSADEKAKDIQETMNKEHFSLKMLFQQKRYLKVIFIGAAVSFFTQTVGINAFNYYAPTIFQQTGFASPSTATFYTMFIGLMLVLSTISSLFFIDRIGRKKPLLIGTFGILITLLCIIFAFTYVTNSLALGWIFLISAIVFMAFHGISIGPACFLIPAEVFPLRVRGLGMGISVAFNWGANVIVAALVPVIIKHLGVSHLFSAFFVITVAAWLTFYFYIPETKSATLEQIERNVLSNIPCRALGEPA
ncbi:MAG: D-xylose-proton symporter [uncultured bacterium]|nr:MAG: D-xylose-proton symporter [uncultured bacterium]